MQTTLKHIGIIMDGNRRWATKKGLPTFMGHSHGSDNLKNIAHACIEYSIPFLTVYALSTENLQKRTKTELHYLFQLISQFSQRASEMNEKNIRIRLIGDIDKLSKKCQTDLLELVHKTKHNTALTLTLAINYGGRDEIVRAVKECISKKTLPLSEKTFQKFLDTKDLPEVDLVVRTGGDIRLSNFLLWQSAYAELYFTKVYWPAFSKKDLQKAIDSFYAAKRNRGK